MKISILCAAPGSNYHKLKTVYDLDIFDKDRDCRNFNFDSPVIVHPPCAQWSRLHHFAKVNKEEKDLAFFCLEAVRKCNGIFEHPAGSHFFRVAGIDRKELFSIYQHWFGFPGRKWTYLYQSNIKYAALPMNFDAIPPNICRTLSSSQRSLTTISFNKWLIDSILSSF